MRNAIIEFVREYVKEYNKQVVKEEGHTRFDDFSETNKASVSALGLLLNRLENLKTSPNNNYIHYNQFRFQLKRRQRK